MIWGRKLRIAPSSVLNPTRTEGSELVIDPDLETETHEGHRCYLTSECVCPKVYLLVSNDLISGLENWCVLHLDAFGHFHDFLQQLSAIADINKGMCWSGNHKHAQQSTLPTSSGTSADCNLFDRCGRWNYCFNNTGILRTATLDGNGKLG